MGAFDRDNIGLTFDYVDFEGPCATCKTDCIDEWERMFEKKFGTGFMVDGTNPDPAGGFPNQIIFGKEWPQYSIKPETYGAGGAMLPVGAGYSTIPLSSEVKIGDIRVAYTDHWVITSGQSEDEETRTFMKRPEGYWAEKEIPMPSQGSMEEAEYESKIVEIDEKRLDWIRCQHTHTDHVHKKTLGGGTTDYNPLDHEYPIAIDDCVTGIWDYNLVDTCTTIERIGIYESVHLYEIFPACGSLSIKSPPDGATDPLIHVINFQPEPAKKHDHSACGCKEHEELYDPGEWFHFMAHCKEHPQPCACPPAVRGQYGKTVMAITSPWCDHTLSQHSKHPHRLGIGHEDGEPQAHLYDNEGQAKVFGAVCETFMYKVGEFYKTTARHFGTSRELFQAPAGAPEVLYTFLHPETGGKGGQSHDSQGSGDGNFWCTSDGFGPQGNAWQKKHGAKMLLQLPCNYPETCSRYFPDGEQDGDGVQCCEDWDVAYCDEQMENIFLDEVALLAAFDRDVRHKGADLTINKSRPRIHKQNDAAVTCETSQVYGWVWLMKPCEDFGQDKWERMGSFPNSPTANCVPAGRRCDCPKYPGPPPNTMFNANVGLMNEVQTSWDADSGQAKIISTLWGLDGIDLGDSCSWSQNTGLSFSHCGVEDAFLIRVDFFEGKLEDGNKIDFERIKKADLHPPETIPKKVTDDVDTPWSEGGMHTDLRTSIAAWTNYDSTLPEQSNGSFSQKGNRFQTDFEAAEVFWKAAGNLYWYDIVAEKGEQLNFMGELKDTPGEPTYLAIAKMEDNPEGMDKRLQDKDGESPCNTPSRVEASTTANEFSDSECGINPAIEGCGKVRTTIFTGVGDPAPRFDQGQRINNADNAVDCGGESDEDDEDENSSSECTQAVDEVFGLSSKLYSCVEGGVSIDNCNNLYFVHKPYIKLKAEFNDGCLGDGEFPEYGFFACGIPVGSVDRSLIGTKGEGDNEHCFCRSKEDGSVIQAVTDFPVVPGGPIRSQQEVCIAPEEEGGLGGEWDCKDFGAPEVSICDTTWSDLAEEYAEGNTYCGLVPQDQGGDDFYFSVSCTSCDNYECGSANDLFAPLIGGGQVYTCKDGVHCCHWLVDNPDYNPDFNPEFDQIMFTTHPQIPSSTCMSTDTFCLVSSYLGGQPHAPYEKGYIWHTVLGWHPDAALDRGVFDYRYSCDAGKSIKIGNEGNHVFDCCDNKQDGEFVECNILFTPKSYERPADVVIPTPPVPVVSLL